MEKRFGDDIKECKTDGFGQINFVIIFNFLSLWTATNEYYNLCMVFNLPVLDMVSCNSIIELTTIASRSELVNHFRA